MAKKIFTDTSDFYSIDSGDEIHFEQKRFRVTGHAREMRFGIEDPKFWVKRAIDLDTGELKYIKLSFFETFKITLGGIDIQCFRSPEKEGEILDLVKGHPYFMQGKVYRDKQQNNIRVLDAVRGKNFLTYIGMFDMPYDAYFKTHLPGILKELVRLFEAIRILHENGYTHGDIRNDHVIRESSSNNLVWIDFDYDYKTDENPFSLDLFGLGNILCYAIGKGFHVYYDIKTRSREYQGLVDRIESDDFSLLGHRRLFNLRKLYPQIPQTLNNILMHFSSGAEIMYETVDEIIEDLNRCLPAFS
ncbi:protein kinase [Desulfobacula sp.]|uniref:protein kinase n=1 Tax=Desulfobacula sp. TaxID=2593537 RepID=UPI0026077F3B|nr:protein kinase [Desulfobacula sp.]